MNKPFNCIGIVGHPRHPTALATHEMLYHWLTGKGYSVLIEQQIARDLNLKDARTASLADIGQQADLAVVVGGDGNMLGRRGYYRAMTFRLSALTAAISDS